MAYLELAPITALELPARGPDINKTWDDLLGHPIVGPSWEGFVIENLIAAAGDRRVPYFYRTADGAEVDLLFERGGRVEMAIEIKRSTAPDVSRGERRSSRS